MNFIPVSCVKLDDPLWSKQFALVKEVVLPYMWDILNDRVEDAARSHCIRNFKIAAGLITGEHLGPVFVDTDLYKWIEAVSYCLAAHDDPGLEKLCDHAVDLIEKAQQPDGYINTYYTDPASRWTNLMEGHELYSAGHLIEAGVAHFQATGKTRLLDVARRFADLIDATFGKNRRRGYPGHPEIELALIRLYEVTAEARYLKLAAYFINERGEGDYLFDQECQREGHTYIFPEMARFKADYFLAHQPVRRQEYATGHAVRAMYLYSGMADLARMTGDEELVEACEKLYKNVVSRQMHITGSIGSARSGERFTVDYELPPDSAYAETCASIGLMFFSSRMWLLDKDKNRYDIWEQALFNTVLSGMGRDGRHFFYVNPLEVVPQNVKMNPMLSHVKTKRQKWFGVACCPPNLARILTSIHGYIYALDGDRLYVLSHIGSSFNKGGLYVKLARSGDQYTLTVEGGPREIFLRLPENSAFSGGTSGEIENGYFIIHHPGGKQRYSYSLKPMIRTLRAHPAVSALAGKRCVQRGLRIYCAEGPDNSLPLSSLRLPANAVFVEENAGWLADDLPVLKTNGFSVSEADQEDMLYSAQSGVYQSQVITFIPYSHWGNRGENEMRVWMNES
jgi:DUF1680 family protein